MRRRTLAGALALLVATAGSAPAAEPARDLWVAPGGDDGGPGTRARPLATLEAARDTIRRWRAASLPVGAVTVWLRGGVYERSTPFRLDTRDGGRDGAPITYRAAPGETPHLVGGREVGTFRPIDAVEEPRLPPAARAYVVVADLFRRGIHDLGALAPRGFRRRASTDALELFFAHRPMPLAGWPDRGWSAIGEVVDAARGRLRWSGDRPARWRAADAWLHGYFAFDWADGYQRIASIDPARRELVLASPQHPYGYRAGQRFRAINLPEELDTPGEWWLDRAAGRLYFWPPAPLDGAPAIVSLLRDAILILDGASHVEVRDLVLEVGRADGIDVHGGAHVRLRGILVRDVGRVGIDVDGGVDDGIIGCEITDVGEDGVRLAGGDRRRHVAGGHFLVDSYVHRFGRVVRTYTPAVALAGVGNRVAHDRLSDGPHLGVLVRGEDHVIEANEIDHVCLETDDAGAVYLGRDPTERGNLVRGNLFHDLGRAPHIQAVYLDDLASGTRVSGNVFDRVAGVLIGGGRDNLVDHNLFIGAAGARIDARGLTWAHRLVGAAPGRSALPTGNRLEDNWCAGCRLVEPHDPIAPLFLRVRGTVWLSANAPRPFSVAVGPRRQAAPARQSSDSSTNRVLVPR